jgi:hypothetical protein
MQAMRRNTEFFRGISARILLALQVIICWGVLSTPACATRASQRPRPTVDGIAWDVSGQWQIEGQRGTIASGDVISPGALLHPVSSGGSHSILIFLADGQRILYECYLARDCARDFRVPSLYRRPVPFAVDLLARFHAVLADESRFPHFGIDQEIHIPRHEVVAGLDPGNDVYIAGLPTALPDGEYTSNIRRVDHRSTQPFRVAFMKKGSSIKLRLPAPGLYDVTVFDQMNRRRIDLFVAAVAPAREALLQKSFARTRALLEAWNEEYPGWPIHDFQRAWLESLVLGISPRLTAPQAATVAEVNEPDNVAEPVFSPRPGVFDDHTAVTLTCATPGAVMHFTVDGSQPFDTSPIYRAPIIVMGTELTIKAFATAPGKKDSAVVTGIFRIQE